MGKIRPRPRASKKTPPKKFPPKKASLRSKLPVSTATTTATATQPRMSRLRRSTSEVMTATTQLDNEEYEASEDYESSNKSERSLDHIQLVRTQEQQNPPLKLKRMMSLDDGRLLEEMAEEHSLKQEARKQKEQLNAKNQEKPSSAGGGGGGVSDSIDLSNVLSEDVMAELENRLEKVLDSLCIIIYIIFNNHHS